MQLADNTSEALDIETINADGSTGDYITINTTDSGETMQLQAGAGPGLLFETSRVRSGAGGQVGLQLEDPSATNPVLLPNYQDPDTGIGWAEADALSLVAGNQEGIRITEAGDAISEVAVKGRTVITANTSGTPDDLSDYDNYVLVLQGSSSNDDETALLFSGSVDSYGGSAIVHKDTGSGGKGELNFYTKQADTQTPPTKVMTLTDGGSVQTIGAVATSLTGTFTATNNDTAISSGSSTQFTTQLHVGSAIKIGNEGTYTVSAIASDTALTLDSVFTGSTGASKSGTTDGGELFAVKTGDSKSLFSVNETGAIGCGSAAGTAHASNNIAIGDDDSLDAITTGVSNVIVGGSNATYQLTTGSSNIFMGYRAGEDCTSTSNSVIVGSLAGCVGNIGSQQTLIGDRAGTSSTDINNVAVGYQAMYDCTGRNNVVMGHSALKATGDADSCVALGFQALVAATGDKNIGIGQDAGDTIVGGFGNICIGHQSDTGAAQEYSIAIGHQVAASVNQKAYIGDGSSSTSIVFSGSGNSWSTASDSRIKENVEDNALGLDFINALRPVKYTEINPQDWPEEIRPHIFFDKTATRINEETGEEEDYTIPASERNPTCADVFDGLIAQEVKAAADAAGTTFSGFEDSEPNGLVRLQYEKFVVPLIKAVQELTSQNESLAARIATLEAGD